MVVIFLADLADFFLAKPLSRKEVLMNGLGHFLAVLSYDNSAVMLCVLTEAKRLKNIRI